MYDKIILTHPKKVVYVQQTNSIPKMSGHKKVKVAGKIRNVWVTVSVYDFVQGYEAIHFQTALMMIREINFNINHTPA